MKNLFYYVMILTFITTYSNAYASSELENTKLKIAIIGCHDEAYDPIGKYAHFNKRKYAQKHGYDVILYTEHLDPSRPAYWNKVTAVKNHLADYDWIFWLDSDALIMNDTIKLEDLIDDRYDFITTRDCLMNINSGQFLIKNSEWSKNFLNNWYDAYGVNIDGAVQDNGGLIKIYKESEETRKHFKIIPLRMLSSYPVCPLFYLIDGQYVKGDFIVHAAGSPTYIAKVEAVKRYFEELYPDQKL